MAETTKGSCLCGTITWEANCEMRPVVMCHCGQCRKQTGYCYAATAADNDALTIRGNTLKWYQASPETMPEAKRGFCTECGSALFWKNESESFTSILAGSIDGDSGLEIVEHIFADDLPDWYEIKDGKPIRKQ
ncbi:MAG: GFA family protein [Rhizobiaceae bacterium]|nr:GFA family protein [Rhizobiaceae bacterium]